MTIERIDEPVRLPRFESAILSGQPEALNDGIKVFTDELEKILQLLIDQGNSSINLNDGDAVYSRDKESDGQYPLGTWRHRQFGNNFIREVLTDRAADTWTQAGAEEPAI